MNKTDRHWREMMLQYAEWALMAGEGKIHLSPASLRDLLLDFEECRERCDELSADFFGTKEVDDE